MPSRTVCSDGTIGPPPLSAFPSSTGTSLQLGLVLLDVGERQEAEREFVAGDALHEHVVVLAGGEVAAARAFLADDRLGEVVVGAGVHAGAEQVDLAVGPRRPHLVPARDLALRLRRPQPLQLVHGDRRRPRVLRVDDDGEPVVGDRQLDVFHARLLAGLDFGRPDRSRRVADVGFAAAELLESAARAGDADRRASSGLAF